MKRLVPQPARHWARRRGQRARLLLRLGRVGGPWRLQPVSRRFGFDRGTPVDRYYIEGFLQRHADDIRGHVLEVGAPIYSKRFGSTAAIARIDVLDIDPENRQATLLLDLGVDDPGAAAGRYDCIICTQTLLLVYDLQAAMGTLHRLLAPDGVLLLTVPGVSQICRDDRGQWEDYWRFTGAAVRRLCESRFSPDRVAVESFGNVLTAASFLYGYAAQELRPRQLDHRDPDYELIVAARAVKS